MCELLGLNANVPTDICFSFSGLMERGGRTGPHKDGWGIAFYEGKGCRTFHDPLASAESEIAKLVKTYSIKSLNVVSHIRQATHGRVCLENTHPFTRELWGRNWAFAHNGKLKKIKRWPLVYYKPIGSTDSEYAFCWVLDQLRQRFPKPPSRPQTLWRAINALFAVVDENGVFNALLSDAKHLYAYCSTKLAWVTRRAPFGEASLIDTEMTIDFSDETTPNDVVSVVATRPLTDNEEWHILKKGDFLVFLDGEPVKGG